MIFLLRIDFFLATKSEKAKINVRKKIDSLLNDALDLFEMEVVNSNQYSIRIESDSWADVVLLTIKLCQSLGRKWIVTGNIDFEFSGWTNDAAIVGVESIGVAIDNVKLEMSC